MLVIIDEVKDVLRETQTDFISCSDTEFKIHFGVALRAIKLKILKHETLKEFLPTMLESPMQFHTGKAMGEDNFSDPDHAYLYHVPYV